MSQLLAIDWDANEVRYVLATMTGPRLKVRSLGAEPIPDSTDDESSATAIGRALREATSGKTPRRGAVLVALRRADVEFLNMTLPPANDTELPEFVANEVLRQSPQLADDATVDFVTLNDDPSEPRIVSAAVCPASQIKRITGYCAEVGLSASRLVVRPYALPTLLKRGEESLPPSCLLVCRVADEVDIAVLCDERVQYTRTVTLPKQADDESDRKRLLAEINRTLAAAPQGPITRSPVEHVYLFGQAAELQDLADQVASEMSLSASIVDPFRTMGVSQSSVPSQAGRFVPLLGMLQDEVKKRHALDFLHPRKPPAPPDRRRQLTMAAAVAAVIVLILGFYVWDSLRALDETNDKLADRLRELDKSVKKATAKRVITESIEDWQASSVNWLDELRDFTMRFPSSRDAVVLHMTLTPSRDRGGEIDLNGLVRDPAIVLRLENNVRDDFHQVRSKRIQERDQEKAYSWHFESRVTVAPRDKTAYLAHFLGDEPASDTQLASDEPVETIPVAAVSPAAKPRLGTSNAEGENHE